MESLVAMVLTSIAIIALLPMQDISARSGFKADYLGRAAGVMQNELEMREYNIMNTNNAVNAGVVSRTVTTSDPVLGTSVPDGDATFDVETTTSAYAIVPNSWLVKVKVTWTGGPAGGISSSIIVTRQFSFS